MVCHKLPKMNGLVNINTGTIMVGHQLRCVVKQQKYPIWCQTIPKASSVDQFRPKMEYPLDRCARATSSFAREHVTPFKLTWFHHRSNRSIRTRAQTHRKAETPKMDYSFHNQLNNFPLHSSSFSTCDTRMSSLEDIFITFIHFNQLEYDKCSTSHASCVACKTNCKALWSSTIRWRCFTAIMMCFHTHTEHTLLKHRWTKAIRRHTKWKV